MRDNAPVRIFDDSESSGVISGRGNVLIASPIPFSNDGMINPGANGGVVLTQGSGSLLPIDLDGAAGNGQLLLNTPFSVLEVNASSLSDSFSGTVNMGSGSLLNMNLTDGWTADASSTFNIASAIVGAAAQIDGGHFTFGGHLNIGGTEGHLRILSDATLTPTADVFIGADDVLEFDGTTILDGGTYQFASGLGVVRFDGPTTVHNGTFQMNGNTHLHGRVEFNGATVWNGNLTVNGFGRQNGNATVSGPTVISGAVFDLNGNNTTWQVNNSLVVNVDRVGSNVDNNFNGTMNITGGVLGRVTINLTHPNDPWVLYGEMNLAGSGALPVTRVAGNRMAVFGDLNVTSGIAQITADVSILDQATVDIAANSTLRMRGHTTVGAATFFHGAGTLQNGLGGSLLLDTGVSLANVGVTNNGVLRIGEIGAGVASVDRFLSTATAAWSVDVGGYVAGSEHDLLQVTGGSAMLDGLLAVTLIDPSGGAGAIFLPSIGDEFTILRARGGVAGAFLNDPVSQVGGLTYDWSVIYNPNTVVLRLDAIVPEPSTLALCIVAALGMSLGRNRLASREVQPNSV